MCNSVWCNKEKDVNTHYRTPARYNRCSLKQQRIIFMCHGQIKWILSSTKSTKKKKKDNSTKRYRDKGNLQFWI